MTSVYPPPISSSYRWYRPKKKKTLTFDHTLYVLVQEANGQVIQTCWHDCLSFQLLCNAMTSFFQIRPKDLDQSTTRTCPLLPLEVEAHAIQSEQWPVVMTCEQSNVYLSPYQHFCTVNINITYYFFFYVP